MESFSIKRVSSSVIARVKWQNKKSKLLYKEQTQSTTIPTYSHFSKKMELRQ